MSVIDICDPSTFPSSQFFEQHPLSRRTPAGYDYLFTKAYVITAKGIQQPGGGGLSELSDLVFTATTYDPPGSKGISKTTKLWEDVLADVLNQQAIVPPNPLDIQIYERSRIIIVLKGGFWEFSRTMEPISTKLDTQGRYFDLQCHGWDGTHVVTPPAPGMPYRAISFFSDTPCDDDKNVRHGFSLNVEFRGGGGPGVLQITIDPDVENKGGLP